MIPPRIKAKEITPITIPAMAPPLSPPVEIEPGIINKENSVK